jgi:cellobiose phosphorylase
LLLDKLYQPINYNDFRQKQKRLARFFEKTKNISGEKTKIKLADLIFDLEEKYKHLGGWLKKKEWLKEGFFNGYYDNRSRRVEGKKNKNMRMMLATQVFAIMSGIATDKQICSIWRAIQKYLKDKKLGGFRLNTNFGAVFTDLGRTFGFSYGDKENGAFFNHMVVMLAYALYKRGFVKEGCAAINSIYKMATAPSAQIYPMIPEYFNSHGQGLYSYLTGSASWFNYTLLEEMLGIKFILGNLLIEPKLVSSNFYNKTITVRLSAQNKIINIQFVKTVTKPFGGRIKELYLEDKKQTQDVKCWLIKKGAIKNITKKEISIFVYLF